MGVRSLHFPVGGLNRRYAYQQQPPFTTPACMNVRPFEPFEGRERGGSRPGLTRTLTDRLDNSRVVNKRPELFVMEVVPIAKLATVEFIDEFPPPEIGNYWTRFGQEPQNQVIPQVLPAGELLWNPHFKGGLLLNQPPTDFDIFQPYEVSVILRPLLPGPNYRFFLKGNVQQEIGIQMAYFTRTIGVDIQTIELFIARGSGELEFIASSALQGEPPSEVELIMRINPVASTVGASVRVPNGAEIFGVPDTLASFPGHAPGVSFYGDGEDSGAICHEFKLKYTTVLQPFFDKPRPLMVGIDSEGAVFANLTPGQLTRAVNGIDVEQELRDGTFDNGTLRGAMSAASFLGKLYIAHEDRKPMVYDPLFESPPGTIRGNTFEWVADRYPSDHPLYPDALKGQEADNSPNGVPWWNHLIARYMGRMVLGGHPDHIWWMSRSGDPHDWDFGRPTDIGRAVNGQSGEYGSLSGALTALVSFSDDYLLFGQRSEIWRLVGEPLAGGRITNISQSVGILDRSAWCVTPELQLVFLGQDGVYLLPPGGYGFPTPVSRETLPEELQDIDPQTNRVILAYDRLDVGVHIFILSLGSSAAQHWWMDWRTKGFWPLSLQAQHLPNGAIWYDGDGTTHATAIFVCRDGFLRNYSSSAGNDDGFGFDSFCDYGPIRLGRVDSETGVLNWVRPYPSATSGRTRVSMRLGRTPEDSFRAAIPSVTEVTERSILSKMGGNACVVRVHGAGDPWAMENIDLDANPVAVAKPL